MCPQGTVCGLTLWNIIINYLIALLSDAPNLRIVVFADDMMIYKAPPLQLFSLLSKAHFKLSKTGVMNTG
jgi:hypothetical protein